MNNFLVIYSLKNSDAYYTNLYAYLKTAIYWAMPYQGVWIIKSNLTAAQIRDGIQSHIYKNDSLLVIDLPLKPGWGTYNLDKAVTDWMKNNL